MRFRFGVVREQSTGFERHAVLARNNQQLITIDGGIVEFHPEKIPARRPMTGDVRFAERSHQFAVQSSHSLAVLDAQFLVDEFLQLTFAQNSIDDARNERTGTATTVNRAVTTEFRHVFVTGTDETQT